jgi:hypothetical protein
METKRIAQRLKRYTQRLIEMQVPGFDPKQLEELMGIYGKDPGSWTPSDLAAVARLSVLLETVPAPE